MKHLSHLALALGLLLTGCAMPGYSGGGGGSYTWFRPDTTDEQMRRDLAAARMDAMALQPISQPAPPPPPLAPGQYDTGAVYRGTAEGQRQAAEEARRQQYFRNSMESKGYSLRRN